jgi:hypothetical protein
VVPVQYENVTGPDIRSMNARAARIARHRVAYIFDVRTVSPLPPATVYP